MRRAPFAEFLLSRFTNREHAAAMVGDLMEIAPGRVAFSLAVLHTAAKFAVAPSFAILAAGASAWLVRGLYVAAVGPATRISEIVTFFGFVGLFLAMIAAYSALRRGLLDPVTTLAAALCAISSTAVLLHASRVATVTCGIFAELLIVGALIPLRTRGAMLRIGAASVSALASSWIAWRLLAATRYPPPHGYPRWFFVVQLLAPAAGAAVALSWRPESPPSPAVE